MVRNPMDFCFFFQNDLQSSFMEKYEPRRERIQKSTAYFRCVRTYLQSENWETSVASIGAAPNSQYDLFPVRKRMKF